MCEIDPTMSAACTAMFCAEALLMEGERPKKVQSSDALESVCSHELLALLLALHHALEGGRVGDLLCD